MRYRAAPQNKHCPSQNSSSRFHQGGAGGSLAIPGAAVEETTCHGNCAEVDESGSMNSF